MDPYRRIKTKYLGVYRVYDGRWSLEETGNGSYEFYNHYPTDDDVERFVKEILECV